MYIQFMILALSDKVLDVMNEQLYIYIYEGYQQREIVVT